MSKTKSYFKSSEIAHVFVHQSAPEGRCASAMTFSGKTFYSYNTPIAELVENKRGERAIIINGTGYSVTTSGHQSALRSAAGHLMSFYVYGVSRNGYSNNMPKTGKELVEYYLAKFGEKQPGEESHYAHVRAIAVLARHNFLHQAINAAQFFGLPTAKMEQKRAKALEEFDAACAVLTAREAKQKEAKFKREAQVREGAVRDAAKWLADDSDLRPVTSAYLAKMDHEPELLAKVEAKNARCYQDQLNAWKRHEPLEISSYNLPVALRREGDEIVTTLGARFPVDHAKRAYVILKKLHERREKFQANGHTIPVGGYRIECMDEAGTVVAGCHRVSWSEVSDLAAREGWDALA